MSGQIEVAAAGEKEAIVKARRWHPSLAGVMLKQRESLARGDAPAIRSGQRIRDHVKDGIRGATFFGLLTAYLALMRNSKEQLRVAEAS
jgi:hypothetical protein